MTTTWKNKFISAIATGALVLGMVPSAALAAGAATLDSTAKDANPAGPGYSLTVSGLENGDTAKYYQIIEQDASTKAWKLTEAVDKNKDGKVDGSDLTVDNFVITDEDAADKRQLTADMMNAVAAAVTTNKAAAIDTLIAVDKKVEVADAAAGMYMFVATPSEDNATYIYKPVFVSCDYYNSVSGPDDGTHQIALVENETGYADDKGVFKKSPLTIDKESGTDTDVQTDVAVGDVIDFTITVPIPTYSSNYTDPVFYVTDSLTEGLELKTDSISVTVAGYEDLAEGTEYKVYKRTYDDASKTENLTATEDATKDYHDFGKTVDADSTFDGFVVEFQKDFLYTVLGAPTATITYQATVTETALQKFAEQVNQMDNTATLVFSNNPNDAEDHGELDDKTRHYTFDIDGNALGATEGETTEIRKVWIDADGNVVQEEETTKLSSGYNWLEGAEFELFKVKNHTVTEPGEGSFSDELDPQVPMHFDAQTHIYSATATANPTSDANGYIAMKGLDAGVYKLKEKTAPLGYAFNPNVEYTITITPTYAYDGTDNDDLILTSYKIEISAPKLNDDLSIATGEDAGTVDTICAYNIKNSILNEDGAQDTTVVTEAVEDITDEATLVPNKKLGLLPATGGSGILFYLFVGGAVAGVSIVLMRKAKKASVTA